MGLLDGIGHARFRSNLGLAGISVHLVRRGALGCEDGSVIPARNPTAACRFRGPELDFGGKVRGRGELATVPRLHAKMRLLLARTFAMLRKHVSPTQEGYIGILPIVAMAEDYATERGMSSSHPEGTYLPHKGHSAEPLTIPRSSRSPLGM